MMTSRHDAPTVTISLPHKRAVELAALLQYGIFCPVAGPQSVLAFLSAQPGLSRAYIESRVETIFINGLPVDCLEDTVAAGDTVALSAAMPGLAGAIFRRQSLHAGLRSVPTPGVQNAETVSPDEAEISECGYICLKLFNAVARDVVGLLLEKGVLLPARALAQYAGRTAAGLPCRWNDEAVSWEAFVRLLRRTPRIFLRLQGSERPYAGGEECSRRP